MLDGNFTGKVGDLDAHQQEPNDRQLVLGVDDRLENDGVCSHLRCSDGFLSPAAWAILWVGFVSCAADACSAASAARRNGVERLCAPHQKCNPLLQVHVLYCVELQRDEPDLEGVLEHLQADARE